MSHQLALDLALPIKSQMVNEISNDRTERNSQRNIITATIGTYDHEIKIADYQFHMRPQAFSVDFPPALEIPKQVDLCLGSDLYKQFFNGLDENEIADSIVTQHRSTHGPVLRVYRNMNPVEK